MITFEAVSLSDILEIAYRQKFVTASCSRQNANTTAFQRTVSSKEWRKNL